MQNTTSLSVVALAAAVGVGVSAGSAHAVIIVDTVDGNAFSPRDTTSFEEPTNQQTALTQGFTLTDPSILHSAALRGFSEGADITIAIANAIGPGAVSGDVLFEQVVGLEADGIGAGVRTFDLGGLELDPGNYFFVVMSHDADGFEWAKVSRTGSLNIGDRGAASFPSGESWYSQTYTFASAPTDQVFTLEIDGTIVPVPSGALVICSIAGLGAVRRRR